MAKICGACKGSGWHGSRSAITERWGGKGSPCRACGGSGYDQRWAEKYCGCGAVIEYRIDWSHVPDHCENCRRDQFKACANPHCSGTVRYKAFWDHIPDYCQCKGWYTTTCLNPHCGQQFQANCNWNDPPKYCKTCKGWLEKVCATLNCGERVRVHCEWTHPPEYCETCKKLGGRRRDPWKDPRNRIESWVNQDTGQMNDKIVSGPDAGVHRYYDKTRRRSGQTGTQRF